MKAVADAAAATAITITMDVAAADHIQLMW